MMTENGITEVVIGCAIKVHRLLESACEECVDYELGETNENLKTKAFAFNMRK
jgi:hypothetical protein